MSNFVQESPEANLWGDVFVSAITDYKRGIASPAWIERTSDNKANFNNAKAFLFGGGDHKRHREYIQDLCNFGSGYVERLLKENGIVLEEEIEQTVIEVKEKKKDDKNKNKNNLRSYIQGLRRKPKSKAIKLSKSK